MDRITKWIDERIDLLGIRQTLLDRKMPGGLTWWHTLGSATLAVFMVQAVTGTILAMYYAPSPDHAYDSIRYLEHSVASGAVLRGIHHWGASAMVVLVVAHAIRVFTMGAYKYPREINWLLGVALLGIVLGFGFTGYLLPWDQKAYWATQVGTNIAGTTPIVGAILVKLLRGGTQLGVATLSRFYALHVLLLPALLAGIALLHLTLVVRQGIAPRTGVLEKNAPPKTNNPEYHHYYREHYAASKGAGVRFWPDIVVKDAIIAMVIVILIFLFAAFVGAGLELPADPSDSSFVPRPEWYFLPFFQLLVRWRGSRSSSCSAPWRCSSAPRSRSRSRRPSRPKSGASSTRRSAPAARCSSASSAAVATSSPARAARTGRATPRTRPNSPTSASATRRRGCTASSRTRHGSTPRRRCRRSARRSFPTRKSRSSLDTCPPFAARTGRPRRSSSSTRSLSQQSQRRNRP
jgi:quinol-cytochrome oxidoreductase complex cytochrome b subunit